ncbi:unnamed protein product [Cochlearia groenlandica]
MRKMNTLLKRGLKIVEDTTLLKTLRSEIQHEISNPRFKEVVTGSLGGFKLDYDSSVSQDIVLRRQFDSGEEVVVSALLQQQPIQVVEGVDTMFPREAVAKVCIKKPGLSSVLQFDCTVSETRSKSSCFDIERACFVCLSGSSLVSSSSSSSPCSTYYGENIFSTLDPKLQYELKRYLISKGINEELTSFLMYHLNKKEQDQYVNWLKKLDSTMSHNLSM